MSTGIESAVGWAINWTPLRHRVDASRATRFVQFCVIGSVGAVIDLTVSLTALGFTHYLLANALGFVLAVSWNFAGNWWVTFDRPEGSLPWQYGSYVGLHGATFAVRAIVIAALVEGSPTPAAVATFVGIGVAAVANFLGSETIFDGDGQLWFDVVAALNQIAHRVYGSRARHLLRATGAYGPLYLCYQHILGLLYRDDTHAVEAAGVSAPIHTEHPAEVVSVMHTLEKERTVLERFVGELREDDVVWDVGANLGVFSVLSGGVASEVVAFEPVPSTASRCRENFALGELSGSAQELALSDSFGLAGLSVERDELGTQTPTLAGDDAELEVQACPGDAVCDDVPAPSVIKVDVEGAELAVLDGLSDTLSRESCRLVYVETHDGTFHDGDSEAVRERLTRHGFDIEVIDADGGQAYFRGEKR